MITNFVDAAGQSFCRGLNGVFGSFPSACLVNGGRPALFLAAVVLAIVGIVLTAGWKRLQR